MSALALKSIEDADFGGKRVFLRVDFNVPLDGRGGVSDDTRIRAALPTIDRLRRAGAKVILASHLGRPKGKPSEGLRLDPVAKRLGDLLGIPVRKLDDCVGPDVEDAVSKLAPGDVILLENLRFHPEEEKNDPGFSRALGGLADAYVNDAFGAAHRAHASTEGITKYLPSYAGLLMLTEVRALSGLVQSPRRPFTVILGGAKVSDKLGVLKNMLSKADRILLGGGIANTFILATGGQTGESLVEVDMAEEARSLLELAKAKGVSVELPDDFAIGDRFDSASQRKVVEAAQVPRGWMALDIGPKTVRRYADAIGLSETIFWNGPMGAFELKPFAEGTVAIALAVSKAGERGAHTVVGGGDSIAALGRAGVTKGISHVSTGGGASLEMVEGRILPGLVPLYRSE